MAYRRCKLPPQRISGEMVTLARDSLALALSSLANHGFKLWTTEKVILPLAVGVSYVDAPTGTLELKDVNLRTATEVTGTGTDGADDYELAFDEESTVHHVAFKLTAAATLDLIVETSDDGVVWATALDIDSATYAADRFYWFDIEGAVASSYIRIRDTDATAFTVDEFYAGSGGREIPMSPMNRNTYASLPDKTGRGRPLQYWLDRQRDTTRVHLWPVPNDDTAHLVAFRERHIMDVGTMTQHLDVPQAWYDAVIAILAHRLSLDTIEVDASLTPGLKAEAAEALATAKSDQRSRSDIIIETDIRRYTRI